MKKIFFLMLIGISMNLYSQQFTEQDTLRGSITPERAWWNLNFYHLDIEVNPDEKFISGNTRKIYAIS